MSSTCPFCDSLDRTRVFHESPLVLGLWDAFPVSAGHALLIPRRHVATWFDASPEEHAALLAAIPIAREAIEVAHRPDGYNLGVNVGAAGGQTVFHLHVHVIPRYGGDVPDPRGGVRHVVPSKANYLTRGDAGPVAPVARAGALASGGSEDPFHRHVLPLFERATDIAIVAAFVQGAGLDRIEEALRRALRRGARVRVVTGDYLTFTQPSALDELLALERECAADDDEGERLPGTLQTRVIETGRIAAPVRSFHPKSWRFQSNAFGAAYVGSSNLTHTALEGVEWNLRVDRDRDPSAYARVEAAFEDLWQVARPIDEAWLAGYTERWKRARTQAVPGEAEADVLAAPPEPHQVQQEALAALAAARGQGRKRAIVVLATGLGKTWLAAFDYAALHAELGRAPRLLFLAHRRELLHQAARTYRCQLNALGSEARIGWFVADEDMLSADLVFASVSKLARKDALARLRTESFDYVVVDEVHHSAADSYRRILGALDPLFLVGLTATPDRADSADILGLFDDFVAYRADIMRGIALRRLTPFRYFGVKDDIDYANIPWRNRRFDPEELARAAQTEARMGTLWRAWQEHPGTRTLVFCCSVAHAVFVRSWLRERGVRVAAVFVADGSDDRDTALRDLEAGALDAVIAVDVFNEGVDVPSVDRVVMLRPTESGVVFLQQLGRGLRVFERKEHVVVIDFVGNHRIFLQRLRTLLSLGDRGTAGSVRDLLTSAEPMELPEGCSVGLEIEAKEVLQKLFRPGGTDEVERAYRELALERGADEDPSQRPTAGEMQRMRYLPSLLRERHGSWLEFVRNEGHLTGSEARAVEVAGPFLRDLETSEMTRCFKMVALQALLDEDALTSGLPIEALARRSHAILRRSPELFADLAEDVRVTTLDAEGLRRFVAYWRKNPIAAWSGQWARGRTYFRVDGDRFRLDLPADRSVSDALARLVGELVDYRLAQYRDRKRETVAASDGFVCKVLSNRRDPILKLPPRQGTTLPLGETGVRLPDGSVWQFRFAKEFCNVARPAGRPSNALPDLLRGWFGPRAGQPGTSFQVRFRASPDGLWAAPVEGQVVALGPRRRVVAYPDLRAAAGHALEAAEAPDAERVWLPLPDASSELFAVRVSGRSMEGGKVPLHDGDWAVFRLARGAPASALENRVVLVQTQRAGAGAQYQIKRLTPAGTGWRFVSDNPEGPSFDASDETLAIARLERTLRPEELAPPEGSTLADADLAASFGLDELTPRTGRHGGHLFVFVDQKDLLIAPDRLRYRGNPRPSETAFVLARRPDGFWRYLGVARHTSDHGVWSLPEVDFDTWRAWGHGRGASRALPAAALAQAQLAVNALLGDEGDRWIARSEGNRARVLGAAARGGLRIDGGEGGFEERTISLVDLAWAIAADADVAENGGVLDEERVNRLRYLEGTPKGSTRWIDSGWALAAWRAVRERVRDAVGSDAALVRMHADDGREMDASFRVERVGGRDTIVFESRGGKLGTRGQRNTEYAEGLRLLLERLGGAGLGLADVVVDTRETAGLPLADRRVVLEGRPYPVQVGDPEELRDGISAAQAMVGRAPGAKGTGNRTRRLRIWVAGDTAPGANALRELVARGRRG